MKSILREQRRSSIVAAAVTILLGLMLVLVPNRSIRFLCGLLGTALMVTGLIYILGWFAKRRDGFPVWFLIPGLLLAALGLWLLSRPASVIVLIQFKRRVIPASNINDAITHTCCLTAKDLEAKAILAATNSGRTARMICRFRPACPVAALTMHEKVRRQLAICWGVIPFLTGEVTSTDRIFSLSAEVALKERLVQNGDTVVITAGVPLGKSGSTNLIKAAIVNEELM